MFTRENLSELQNIGQLLTMDWSDFEWFSKYFFEHLGYERTHVREKHGELAGDGGVDVEMFSNNEKIYVQCKRWNFGFNETILPIRIIRELGGCMLRDRVNRGIVMTTLGLDETCKREAQLMNIELYGLMQIAEKMKMINPNFDVVLKKKKLGFWRRLFLIIGAVVRFFRN